MSDKIAVVAIARDERPFLDEWIQYHLLIGTDQIIIYDDDPLPGLKEFLLPHGEGVKVVRWFDQHQKFPGARGDRQTKAYLHSLSLLKGFEWVAFIDIDEFMVLNYHNRLKEFLSSMKDNVSAVALNAYVFGHNGYYDNTPRQLIATTLTRRKGEHVSHYKCITKCECIVGIKSVHLCQLTPGTYLADANGQVFQDNATYPGKTRFAHLNHYMCRSFSTWMKRPERGEACDIPALVQNDWKRTKEGCLRKFVEEVAVGWNEYCDNSMLRFRDLLSHQVKEIVDKRNSL